MSSVSLDDKLVVARARKIERFFSQPFFVAEQFTGFKGKYVQVAETGRGEQRVAACVRGHVTVRVPRETLRLEGSTALPRLVSRSGIDHTRGMLTWSARRLEALEHREEPS